MHCQLFAQQKSQLNAGFEASVKSWISQYISMIPAISEKYIVRLSLKCDDEVAIRMELPDGDLFPRLREACAFHPLQAMHFEFGRIGVVRMRRE